MKTIGGGGDRGGGGRGDFLWEKKSRDLAEFSKFSSASVFDSNA